MQRRKKKLKMKFIYMIINTIIINMRLLLTRFIINHWNEWQIHHIYENYNFFTIAMQRSSQIDDNYVIKKQHLNSAKFDENRLKKIRAWCEINVTMLFKSFYKILWIESLKTESMKINKIVFVSISNRAARKCLSHSFIITKLVKQLQLAFSIFNEIINFNWYHFFFFAIHRLFWKRAFNKLSRTYINIAWIYNYWLSAARMYIRLINSK